MVRLHYIVPLSITPLMYENVLYRMVLIYMPETVKCRWTMPLRKREKVSCVMRWQDNPYYTKDRP
jgi:hypothetical protein